MQVPESVSTPASPDPSTLGPSLSTSTFGPSLDPSTVVPAASDVLEASALPLPVTLPPQPHARKMHVATRCPRKQSRSTQGACAMDQPTTSAGLPPRPRPARHGRQQVSSAYAQAPEGPASKQFISALKVHVPPASAQAGRVSAGEEHALGSPWHLP
jgi:hypothetical protein